MTFVLECVLKDIKEPFVFSQYHKAVREPFDYYTFGQNYIRPLVDLKNSYVGNVSIFSEMEEKLRQGENVVMMSNHQSEADPAVIALLLESTNRYLAENLDLKEVYAGFYPAVLGSTFSLILYFFFYSKVKQRYLETRKELSPGLNLIAAAEARGLDSIYTIWFAYALILFGL